MKNRIGNKLSEDQALPVQARGVGACEGEWRNEEGAPCNERRRIDEVAGFQSLARSGPH